ncbi:PLP-dependent aminotransferase family protein [Sphingobacterium spiritivorum]|uniref:aminotransferase-like domain-containing protein n=1 Tax=Sphingobacterium spiritivorum TaxID=258 RepID=UPI003DA36670
MDSPIIIQLFQRIQLDTNVSRAIYLQLADSILEYLRNGSLRAGQKLPSSRETAKMLGLNRITVSKAYSELEVQGWLVSSVGKGTFVSDHVVDQEPRKLARGLAETTPHNIAGFTVNKIDYVAGVNEISIPDLHLDDGYPDPRLAPLMELYRAYRNQLTRGGLYHRFGSYGNAAGSDHYRHTIADYLNATRGLKCQATNILSVRGTLMGINLVCSGLIAPGDLVVTGLPGWNRVTSNLIHVGARHIGLPVDEHGLVVEELRKLCLREKVRMVYVTPHHHYPTTVSLRIDRRLELLRLANEFRFIILEDDYDFDFHYKHRPLLPLASEDENAMVVYCGSFSKSFSPAFRMGYIVAAENVIEQLAMVRILHDRQGDHILDNAMADIISDGTIQRYLRRTLPVYEQRRNLFCQLMNSELGDSVNFEIPDGGMSVWTKFDPSIDLNHLVTKAYQKGLLMSDGEVGTTSPLYQNGLRLGFASSTDEELIRSVEIIKKIIG